MGVRGSTLIESFEDTLKKAQENAPAVIFIDDVDTLFTNDDTYRAFLTLLDGMDNAKRTNVCIIVTCMNLGNIPASLLRGGRLEMCLFTKLPTTEHIQRMVRRGLEKITKTVLETLEEETRKEYFLFEIFFPRFFFQCLKYSLRYLL